MPNSVPILTPCEALAAIDIAASFHPTAVKTWRPSNTQFEAWPAKPPAKRLPTVVEPRGGATKAAMVNGLQCHTCMMKLAQSRLPGNIVAQACVKLKLNLSLSA